MMFDEAYWLRWFNYRRLPRARGNRDQFLTCVDSHVTLGKSAAGSTAKMGAVLAPPHSDQTPLEAYEDVI